MVLVLVPRPLRGISAYRLLEEAAWNRIRLAVLEKTGHACGYCGAKGGGLTCHEKWLYLEPKALPNWSGWP
jgi:hypothetical protein